MACACKNKKSKSNQVTAVQQVTKTNVVTNATPKPTTSVGSTVKKKVVKRIMFKRHV